MLNRAGFEVCIERSVRVDGGETLALLYIDLDHFKPINDTHGHPVGDRLLQLFAQRLRRIVRPTDAVARLGGDEFAIVLPRVRELSNAEAVVDKVIAVRRESRRHVVSDERGRAQTARMSRARTGTGTGTGPPTTRPYITATLFRTLREQAS